MTQTGYFAPPSLASHRPAIWRIVLTVVVAVFGPLSAAVAGFAAIITWSGCFLSCTGANHGGGFLLGLLALGLLASGPVLAWVLLRSIVWVAATIVLPVPVVLAFLLG
jgi:hypothetical protein